MKFTSIIIVLLFVCSSAFAIDSRGLTKMQEAEIQIQIEKMKDQKPIAEQAKELASISHEIAKAIGSTAKELGVEVNNFAVTPVGKMTMYIIVWKMLGSELLHYIVGIGTFVVMLPIWWAVFKRMVLVESVEWTDSPNGKKRLKKINYRTNWPESRCFWSAACIIWFIGIWISSAVTFWI